ncbi:MAG: glycosyltransferase family 39 protein [Candidatus Altiarchaeota archaeon]
MKLRYFLEAQEREYIRLYPIIRFILAWFISTRIMLSVIGTWSRIIFHKTTRTYSQHVWLDIWGVWDSKWYLDIAKNGYSLAVRDRFGSVNVAFFPFYSTLIKLLERLVGDYFISGLIISNICLIIACIFLYKLSRLDYDEETALNSVKYLFLFPTAFIYSGVFTESTYLALVLTCMYYARREKWVIVGVLGYFTALTKAFGVLIILPLLYEYFKSIGFDWRKIRKNILLMALIPLGLSTLMYYHHQTFDKPIVFMEVQSTWGRHLANPLTTLAAELKSKDEVRRFESYFWIATMLILISFWRKIRFSYLILSMYTLVGPLITGTVWSMPRFALVVFPMYMIFAIISRGRRMEAILATSMLLQGFLMGLWAIGLRIIV